MDKFNNFVSILCPTQCTFVKLKTVQKNPVVLKSLLVENDVSFLSYWQKVLNLTTEDIKNFDLLENAKIYNLYTSILCQLCPKYNILYDFDRKYELVDEFIRFLIYKLDSDTYVKNMIHKTKIHEAHLVNEIKNRDYQSNNVVWYISLIFDINIIVLSNKKVKIYYSDDVYDTCKPNILLRQDDIYIYHPLIYKNNRTLTYFDHNIIKLLVKLDIEK